VYIHHQYHFRQLSPKINGWFVGFAYYRTTFPLIWFINLLIYLTNITGALALNASMADVHQLLPILFATSEWLA
jgi:hypothetical protein